MPNEQAPPTGKMKLELIPTIIYGVIAVAILFVIGWGLAGKDGFLKSLSDKEVARGLITFLIAITTVGIGVILAISTLFGKDGDGEDKRFDRGKQVLSTLIGVLGTIVGFYFGAVTETKASTTQPQELALALAPPRVSNTQPAKGSKVTISSFVLNGKAPYTFSITFDSTLTSITDKASPDGVIKEEVAVPENLAADKDVTYRIGVKDSEGKTFELKENTQKLSLKAK